jgi:hypothetical protein
MKRLFLILISSGLLIGLVAAKPLYFKHDYPKKPLPRIAIAGLGIESSTFSPALTDEAAFHAKYGVDIFSIYPFFSADSSLRKRAIWGANY